LLICQKNHDILSVVLPPGGFTALTQYFLGDPAVSMVLSTSRGLFGGLLKR